MPEADFADGIHVERHRDGSPRARGPLVDGQPDGFREWFRLDGTRLRSGHFDSGRVVGEWTTYDRTGAVHEITDRGSAGSRPEPVRAACGTLSACASSVTAQPAT